MAKGSDNPFPSVLMVKGAAPAAPAVGSIRIFTDSADGVVKAIDSAGAITLVQRPGLTVQDENVTLSSAVTQIDFQGAGVTATLGTGEVVVTIPGGGSGTTALSPYLLMGA